MVICLTGAKVKPGMEVEEERVSSQIAATLRSSTGFVAVKTYRSDDGELITVIRFKTDEDLTSWRDTGLHGEYEGLVGDLYESFWVQTATVHREYEWRDGERIEGSESWAFGQTTG